MVGRESNEISSALESWYQRENGQYALNQLSQALQPVLDLTFGYHIAQLAPLAGIDLLADSPINHRIQVTSFGGAEAGLITSFEELPLESDSVDALVAFHCLEFSEDPHQALREMQRVLTPSGHLIIIGFNPLSFSGVLQRLKRIAGRAPWQRHTALSAHRLKDWMRLLQCPTEKLTHLYTVPPLGSGRLRSAMVRADAFCLRHNVSAGGIYMIHAIKQVAGGRKVQRRRKRERLIELAVPKSGVAPSPVPSSGVQTKSKKTAYEIR
ncbi:class I SAM-dependent methyltransferase [Parahalioglobus pacificus]|uniref:Methyltransferase type 11 domain-containing protein n=1 Tax=Parahalioglobus pacificus TaxID=930806 RepID=A0A918XFG1_9GAMM|nr:class I SAM-dependent methyltransferase [Halioglobus pacificus]GHD29654.1 hypothetical protein GCM10007053_10550 [Halioglobus pacificus]